jgi:heat shock protein HslJ
MKKLILAAAIAAIVVAGCGKTQKPATLGSHDWELSEVVFKDSMGTVLNTETPPVGVTLAFDDSLMLASGRGGCNRYSTPYDMGDQNTISFTMPAMTQMACPNLEFENRYMAWLTNIDSYAVTNEELQLKGTEITLLYKPEFK